MTVYSLENGMLGVRNERPDINDPTIPRNGSQPPTYICIDTLEVFQDTGSDWLLVGQFGISGVLSDEQTPGGIEVAGGMTLGTSQGNVPDPNYPVMFWNGDYFNSFLNWWFFTQMVIGGGTLATGEIFNADGLLRVSAGAAKVYAYDLVITNGGIDAASGLIAAAALEVNCPIPDNLVIYAHDPAFTPIFEVNGHGQVTTANASLSGAGGTTPTLALSKLAGQTGLLIACTDENNSPKVSIAVDGEIVTADDVLAPNGVIKGATVALYTSGTGAPTSGTHSKGEFHGDTAGALFYCTADGTPGTWAQVNLV